MSIYVSENDIYVAGYESEPLGLNVVATYWKNGIAVLAFFQKIFFRKFIKISN